MYQLLIAIRRTVLLCCISVPALAAIEPIKSPNDDRAYRSFTLENKLKVMLISDPDTVKGAAALDVHVGAGADPEGRQGLAHFLEHMLFLGTAKYPNAGEYQEFISSHGGGHNAYTSYEDTNYFFDIDADHLEPALDRFAQFFIEPLFNSEYVAREVNAVESEYRAKLKEDNRRSLDVFKEIIHPEHSFNKLSVGNLQTLWPEHQGSEQEKQQGVTALREALLSFYAKHYSSDRMTLVVLGKQPLDTLQAWVENRFKHVTKRKRYKAPKEPGLFSEEFLPKLVELKPEKDTRSLVVTFPIPEVTPEWKTKPDQYLGNILGHEGQGSLLSLLKANGWAEGLSAGAGLEYDGGATFNVSIKLTPEGLAHRDDIIEALFALIDLIRKDGIDAWRQKEQGDLLDVAFRFQESGREISYASQIAAAMHHYPARDVLRGGYYLKSLKKSKLKRILNDLRPDNALYSVMFNAEAFDKNSHWYSTPYSVKSLPPEVLARWRSPREFVELALPERNPFIAKDLALLERPADAALKPQKLEAAGELWWGFNTEFGVPKAQLYFNLQSPLANETVEFAALSSLMSDVLADSLNEFSYPAYLAGVNFDVRRHLRGLSIRVGGFSDQQALLLATIAEHLRSPQADGGRIASLREERIRSWRNEAKRMPYQLLFGRLNNELVDHSYASAALADALEQLSVRDFRDYWHRYLKSVNLESMMVGNLSKKDAIALNAIVADTLECTTPCAKPTVSVARLDKGSHYADTLELDHPDSAVLQYLQADDQSIGSQATMAVATQILRAPYFQTLRTEQQLGYIVFATTLPIFDVPGMGFIVQSPTADVSRILKSTDEFIGAQRAKWLDDKAEKLSDLREEFAQHKLGLLNELAQKPRNLSEQSEKYWSDLSLGRTNFDTRAQLIEAVSGLSFEAWQNWLRSAFESSATMIAPGARPVGHLSEDLTSARLLSDTLNERAFRIGEQSTTTE